MNEITVHIENLCKSYQQNGNQLTVLEKIYLDANKGEVVAIVGRSGSGKSTLLQLIGLLDDASSGQITLLGQQTSNLSQRQKDQFRLHHIGFVYQQHHLLPDFTALENILMPTIIAGEKGSIAIKRAKELMDQLGVIERANYLPGQLSGGQMQRVAIARAMINNPAIILADEPTGNLDNLNAAAVFKLLKQIAREKNTTVLLVTHSATLATQSHKTLLLEDGKLHQSKLI
jgi:lipoprotein-releasing system ATP-binding protein